MKVYCQRDMADAAIRSHGCGAVTGMNMCVAASGDTWRADDPTDSARFRVKASGATPAQFRSRGLTSSELATSMHAVQATDVRMDLPVQRRSGVDVRGVLLPQLVAEDAVAAVAVRYGVVVDAGVGYGTYRLGHWVLVTGADLAKGTVQVADPLRRQLVTWPVDVLVRAMETFGDKPWGGGRGEAIVAWRWETWRAGYATATAQRDLARKQRDAAKAALAECQSQGPDAAALAAARAKGIADAAAAAGAVK